MTTNSLLIDALILLVGVSLATYGALYWSQVLVGLQWLKQRGTYLVAIGAALVVLYCWYFWAKDGANMVVGRWTDSSAGTGADALGRAGQAGDLFGGFNALVTAFTFFGAVGALIYQAKAMKAARDQLTLQQFEPMFLYLMEQYRQLEKGLTLDVRARRSYPKQGQLTAAVLVWHLEIQDEIADKFPDRRPQAQRHSAVIESIRQYYESVIYRHNHDELGKLFRALFHVFKAIKVSNLSDAQKIRYANIARLTLDQRLLFLLALNGLTTPGGEFRLLINEYGILKHLFGEAGEAMTLTAARYVAMHGFEPTASMSGGRRAEYWKQNPEKRPGKWSEH